ncbi:MAG TPA: HNH endonuclease [Tenuifilaceae bacterium]|nr:HNH endonuclease [Tenuifilaceae bacterium]HPI44147.1 HNH endonuclease [Tenuifilaceae bacterium]HPN22189.1 HNH endonuclease [Tenuifilaceae bacterium]
MEYCDQLKTSDWKNKRRRILQRDDFICKSCNNQFEKNLQYGLAYNLQNNIDRDFIKYRLRNIDKDFVPQYSDPVSLQKETVLREFKSIPKLIWVEYAIDDLNVQNIYTIRQINDNHIDSLLRFIFESPQIESTNNVVDFNSPIRNRLYKPELLKLKKDYKVCLSFFLNVHHLVYRDNKLAWEYPDDDLITLCWKCHEKLHETAKIPWLDENGSIKGNLTPCFRCFGAGYFPEYLHVENGRCFRCHGKRFEQFM